MKSQKTDVRSRYTQSVIIQSYLELLKDKNNKVTVAQICELAGINRGTFYNHFYDIDDVYQSIEDSLFHTITDKLNAITVSTLGYNFFYDILNIISQNSILITDILLNIEHNSLFKRLTLFAKDKYIHDFLSINPNMDISLINTVFTYMLNGSIGIISEWVKTNSTNNIDNICLNITKLNEAVISTLINR